MEASRSLCSGLTRVTEAVRRATRHGQASLRVLAKRYGVNQKTIAKWKQRTSVTEVRTAEGKLHLSAAIHRVAKFAFVQLHEKATRRVASDVLPALVKAVPDRIHTILTDNDTHFTDPRDPGSVAAEIREAIAAGELFRAHAFDYACAQLDIEHRLTNQSIPGPMVRSSR